MSDIEFRRELYLVGIAVRIKAFHNNPTREQWYILIDSLRILEGRRIY